MQPGWWLKNPAAPRHVFRSGCTLELAPLAVTLEKAAWAGAQPGRRVSSKWKRGHWAHPASAACSRTEQALSLKSWGRGVITSWDSFKNMQWVCEKDIAVMPYTKGNTSGLIPFMMIPLQAEVGPKSKDLKGLSTTGSTDILCCMIFCYGSCSMHCKMFQIIPDTYLLRYLQHSSKLWQSKISSVPNVPFESNFSLRTVVREELTLDLGQGHCGVLRTIGMFVNVFVC